LLSNLVCVVTRPEVLVAVVIGWDPIFVANCREAVSLAEMHIEREMDGDGEVKVVVVLARRDANGCGMLRNPKMSQLARGFTKTRKLSRE
jgi:hypothetical protein